MVYPAIHLSEKYEKTYNDKIRILFLGSINNPNSFLYKGGLFALFAFKELSKRFDIELIIRSEVPVSIKKHINKRYKNVQIIDKIVPKDELEKIFQSTDISLLPSHNYPLMAMLESMSYGIPVVTVDGWANSEFIEHGKWGFVTKPSKFVRVDDPVGKIPNYIQKVRKIDLDTVREIVRYTSELIESDSLRRKFGVNARKEIEKGKFSINKRNEKLRKIYEEALRK